MGKKRNQSEEERNVHKRATALRKMTDEQLISTIDGAVKPKVNEVEQFIKAFETADVPSIGKVTIKKIRTFASENGFI